MEKTAKGLMMLVFALLALTFSVVLSLALLNDFILPQAVVASNHLAMINWNAIMRTLVLGVIAFVTLATLWMWLVRLIRRTLFPKPET